MIFNVIKYIPPYTSLVIFFVFLGCNLKKKNNPWNTSYYNLGQRSNCQKNKQFINYPRLKILELQAITIEEYELQVKKVRKRKSLMLNEI